MKRRVAMATAVFAVLAAAAAAFAAAPDNAIEIDVIRKNQPPVAFRHKAHKTLACRMCHHADERNREKRCSVCHAENADGMKPGLKEAFHRSCIGCHKKARRGPVVCTRCHRLNR
jgi:uncharacterized protein (DUF2141 family)